MSNPCWSMYCWMLECPCFLRSAILGGVYGWIKIGSAPNETVALMMEGILRNADIPVLIRRPAGFDVPDFLSGGPRELLVPEDALPEARELLEDTTGSGSWV